MISVILITKNEEANIERCLRSVQWADEIIVVDAESTDRTVSIAKSLNANVITRKWEGFAKQKEFALHQATNEWILSVDADEEVTDALKTEIQTLTQQQGTLNGYEIPRKSFFLGKWIKNGGWYPGYQLRLFKKLKAKMNHRTVHEGFLVEGMIGIIKSDLNHYIYNNIEQYINKMNDYSSLDVVNKLAKRKAIRWYNFVLNPLSTFLRMYVSLRGFKDGFHGFLLAYYSALNSLATYAKSWEYQNAIKEKQSEPPITSEALLQLRNLVE